MVNNNDNDDAMSGLSSFFSSIPEQREEKTPQEKVEAALSKALDNTTPSSPGTPWTQKEDNEDSDLQLRQELLDRLLGR